MALPVQPPRAALKIDRTVCRRTTYKDTDGDGNDEERCNQLVSTVIKGPLPRWANDAEGVRGSKLDSRSVRFALQFEVSGHVCRRCGAWSQGKRYKRARRSKYAAYNDIALNYPKESRNFVAACSMKNVSPVPAKMEGSFATLDLPATPQSLSSSRRPHLLTELSEVRKSRRIGALWKQFSASALATTAAHAARVLIPISPSEMQDEVFHKHDCPSETEDSLTVESHLGRLFQIQNAAVKRYWNNVLAAVSRLPYYISVLPPIEM